MSIATLLAALSLAIWAYLLLARGGFWRAAERESRRRLRPEAAGDGALAVRR